MKRLFFRISIVAVIWFIISIILAFALIGVEDPPNINSASPWLVKFLSAIVFFPMRYLQHWDESHENMSDQQGALLLFLGMLVNGVLWGILLAALRELVARINRLSIRKRVAH